MNKNFIRAEIKDKAKKIVFTKNYFYLLSLALVFGFACAFYFGSMVYLDETSNIAYVDLTLLNFTVYRFYPAQLNLAYKIISIGSVAWSIFTIFIGNVLTYGIRNAYYQVSLGNWKYSIFEGFKHNYWNIVKTLFLKSLYITLWTLCFVIPGIVRQYDYYFVDYILAKDPTRKSGEVLKEAKELVMGYKANIFVFDLSFFLWLFLGAALQTITFGLGRVLVYPYILESQALLYSHFNTHSQPIYAEQAIN